MVDASHLGIYQGDEAGGMSSSLQGELLVPNAIDAVPGAQHQRYVCAKLSSFC